MTIRVLVVDDSVVVRRIVAGLLDAEDGIEVVATAVNGKTGLEKIEQFAPDVVTLDVEMPVMSGLEALSEIRRRWPRLPVIMYSTVTERGAEATFAALSLGAVDYATKPTNVTSREEVTLDIREQLVPRVRNWGRRSAPVTSPSARPDPPVGSTQRAVSHRTTIISGKVELVVIGVSTGGPDALARLLPRLAPNLRVPIVIVQHMPPMFTAMLAQRLDKVTALKVTETVDGELIEPGRIYVAAGGVHTHVQRAAGRLVIAHGEGPKENSCRPAVDVMFRSAAAATGGRLTGFVLTGMGQDGLLGAHAIREAGGTVYAQDEETSVVWGMPGFVAKGGLAAAVLPLDDLADPINSLAFRVSAGAAK